MISVVGLGVGAADYLTPLARRLIDESDWIVGSDRQLAAIAPYAAQEHLLDKKLADVVTWLIAHQDQKIVVLASGDPMLYGIGKYLSTQLGRDKVNLVSGISSLQYIFARIGLDMNDVYLTSSHGKVPDFDFMLQHKKVALVTDDKIGPYQIAQQILQRNLQRTLIIGENLSYPDEQITLLPASEVVDKTYPMNVVVIVDER